MSIERELQELIRDEVEAAIAPLRHQLDQLHQHGQVVERLTNLFGGRVTTRLKRARASAVEHGCAIIACKRPARSKGYCSAHYMKRRMLLKTKRLPSAWSENAAPQSVQNILLPRGRRPN